MKNQLPYLNLDARIVLVTTVVMISMSLPAGAQPQQVTQLKNGYLFIDGNYVAPPYEISHTDSSLTISGHTLDESFFGTSSFERENAPGWARQGRRMGLMQPDPESRGGPNQGNGPDQRRRSDRRGGLGRWERRGPHALSPMARIANRLDELSFKAIVILYPQQKPLVLYPNQGGHQLLAQLIGDSSEPMPSHLDPVYQETWQRLISEYEPSDEFTTRVKTEFADYASAARESERTSAALFLVAQISYPLTVFAMVVVVFAFGHLLSSKPTLDDVSDGGVKAQQFVVKSLIIIAICSALDLVWTMSATYAGTMREINPLGSRMIEDPTLLVLFKLMVTGTSIGILYALHRRPIAQVASWWCCLVLTLLTARWVVFQSIFV